MEALELFTREIKNESILQNVYVTQPSRANNYEMKVNLYLEDRFSDLGFSETDLLELAVILQNSNEFEVKDLNHRIYLQIVQRKLNIFNTASDGIYMHKVVIALIYHLFNDTSIISEYGFKDMSTTSQIKMIHNALKDQNRLNLAIPAKSRLLTYNLTKSKFASEQEVIRLISWDQNALDDELAFYSSHMFYHYNIVHYHVNLDYESYYHLQLYNVKRTWLSTIDINNNNVDPKSRINYALKLNRMPNLTESQVKNLLKLQWAMILDVDSDKDRINRLSLEEIDFIIRSMPCNFKQLKSLQKIYINTVQNEYVQAMHDQKGLDLKNIVVVEVPDQRVTSDKITSGLRLVKMIPQGTAIDIGAYTKYIRTKPRRIANTSNLIPNYYGYMPIPVYGRIDEINTPYDVIAEKPKTDLTKVADVYLKGKKNINSKLQAQYLRNITSGNNYKVQINENGFVTGGSQEIDVSRTLDAGFLQSMFLLYLIEELTTESQLSTGTRITCVDFNISQEVITMMSDLYEIRSFSYASDSSGVLVNDYNLIDFGNFITIINLCNVKYEEQQLINWLEDLPDMTVIYIDNDIKNFLNDVIKRNSSLYYGLGYSLTDGVVATSMKIMISKNKTNITPLQLKSEVVVDIVTAFMLEKYTTVSTLFSNYNDDFDDVYNVGDFVETMVAEVPFNELSNMVSIFSCLMDYVNVSKVNDTFMQVAGVTSRSLMNYTRRTGGFRKIESMSYLNFLTTSYMNVFTGATYPKISVQEIVTQTGHLKIYFDRLIRDGNASNPIVELGGAFFTNLFLTSGEYTLVDSVDYTKYGGEGINVYHESIDITQLLPSYGRGDKVAFNSIFFTQFRQGRNSNDVINLLLQHFDGDILNSGENYYFNIPVIDDRYVNEIAKIVPIKKVETDYQIKLGSYDYIDMLTRNEFINFIAKLNAIHKVTILNLTVKDCINAVTSQCRSYDVIDVINAVYLSSVLPLVKIV